MSSRLPLYPIPEDETKTKTMVSYWICSEGHIILEYFIVIIDKLMIMFPNDVPTDGTWLLLTIIHWEDLMLPEWDV